MARQLHFATAKPLDASQAALAAVTLLLCAFAFIKCASHSRKLRRQWRACYEFFEDDYDPVIEIHHQFTRGAAINGDQPEDVAQINGDQPQDVVVDNTTMFSREQPVWQKNILMGGKCQLPDFSGVIIYDSEGNIVPPTKTPHPLLTWK